ncbi:MAG TPA: Calx-beta domain-containing protein [Pyrinomonadaceae bacterium]
MLTPIPPRAAAHRRLSALALFAILLNLLPVSAPTAVARVQSGTTSFVRVLNLPTNDLVYDKQTQRLFVSVPSTAGANGNSVTEVDPVAGAVGPSVFVGSEPNRLGLSEDGQALYVGLDGASAFRRFDVATRTPGLQVSLGGDSFSGTYVVGDFSVSPTNRDAVAVARSRPSVSPPGGGVVVYDNGVKRTNGTTDSSVNFIAFSEAETTLYGSSSFGTNLFKMTVDASGVSSTSTVTATISGDIQFAGGRVYGATGRVVDPASGTLAGTFTGVSGPFAVDAAAGRAFYVVNSAPSNQTLIVRAFDINTFNPVGDITLTGVNGTAGGLVRWGTNGLALRTTAGQLFLIQTTLIPSADPVPTPTPTPVATPTPTPTPEPFNASVRHIPFRTKDLIYNPSTQVIHASVPSVVGAGGNSVAAINPADASVGPPVFVGSEPNKLGLSDDGQALYVGLDGAKAVRRFDVPTQTAGQQFSLGSENFAGPYFATDIEVMPGSPNTVAVARSNFSSTSVAVYDNGVKRANDGNGAGTDIEFGATNTRLYSNVSCCGTGIQRYAVSASGVTFESSASVGRAGAFAFAGGLLYTSGGSVIEPESGTLKGTFAVGSVGQNTLIAVDEALGRAYFLTVPTGLTAQLSVFDLNTFLPIGRLTINNIGYTQNPDGFQISSLVRWGENGLAFRTTTHVMLIQSALVNPSGAVPDPTPTPTATPTPSPTPQAPTFVRQFNLPVNDFAYSTATQKLYAAVPSIAGASGNSVTEVEPSTGAAGPSVFIGSEPRMLAISDNGGVIWAKLDGANAVRRFDVATKTAGLQFTVPAGFTRDLEVMPGSPETVAFSTGGAPLVYDSGVQRPASPTVPFISVGPIEFSTDPTVLYGFNNGDTGFDFFRLKVAPTGVTREATARGLVGGGFAGGIEYFGGRMYGRSGEVFDPDTFTPIGVYKGVDAFSAVAVDATLRRVFYVSENGLNMVLRAYDMDTFLPLGQATLPFGGTPTRLVRWGANGLALHAFTSGGGDAQRQLYLIQSALVSTAGTVPTGVIMVPGNFSISENSFGATATFLRTGDLSGTSTAEYATADGTATDRGDYTTALGTVRFAPGESQKTVTVLITDDEIQEPAETFTVSLTGATGAELLTPNSATFSIFDDDFFQNGLNPIDDAQFFVRQHYADFLNRAPDPSGFNFWTGEILSCQQNAQCREVKRNNVSAAFFLSIEFQRTGYLVYRLHQASFATGETLGMRPFLKDTREIGDGIIVGAQGWEEQLEKNTRDFIARFVARPEFAAAYPASMTATQFVDALNANTGGSLTQGERDQLVADLTAGTKTRAEVLRAVAENTVFSQRQFNRAFVYMQYVGYLRRNPNATPDTDYTGFNFWLTKLNEFNGNYIEAEMVKGFIQSIEYRKRFAP